MRQAVSERAASADELRNRTTAAGFALGQGTRPVGGSISTVTPAQPGTDPQPAPLQGDRAPRHKGNAWFLALTALGVVFGDIGTSPLYTFSVALSATGHARARRGRRPRDRLADPLGADGDGVAEIRRLRPARRQRWRRRNPGPDVAWWPPTGSRAPAGFHLWSCSASPARHCSMATASSRRRSPCCRPWRD